MSLTGRDRRIVAVLLAVGVVAAYWFLLLGPKREEARQAAADLVEQEERRDTAVAQVADLQAAERSFESDYATVVRLGKAIPSTVDVPSLMVQLQDAARGTSISFDAITTGEREAAPVATTAPPADGATGDSATATPAAGDAAAPSPGTSTPPPPGSTSTSTPSPGSATPPATDTTATSAAGTIAPPGGVAPTQPALESVPLEFQFSGSFFELADFFHKMKRFVHVGGQRIDVHGRLMTLDSLTVSSEPEAFPLLTAEVSATVYVSPVAEGTTAGATPQGPSAAAPAAAEAADGPTEAPSSAPPPSAAAVTP